VTDTPPKPDRESKTDDAKSSNPFVVLARYSEIGFILPAAVVVGYLIGLALDHWLHTHWIYVAGLIFGAIVGFVKMILMALASSNERE
jgi:F0F1-type ATP synthase assembly protein I